MNHIKSYQVFEATDTAELTFKPYFDKMLPEDENKMNALLDRGYETWSADEKEFMKKMSRKSVPLFVGSDNNIYTEEEIEEMGLDVNDLTIKKEKPTSFINDVKDVIKKYNEALRSSREALKHNEEYDMTKIVNPIVRTLDSAIYELGKLI